jgi:Conjugative transposon protein TcpC
MPAASARPTVPITARPLWRIRLTRGLPRYLLYALCVTGLLASARFAIDPPRPRAPAAARSLPPGPDLAAQGYAALFARRYLTWNAAEPEASEHLLTSQLGPGIEPNAGLRLPSSGAQHVAWVEVVQAREPSPGEHVYTVAAQTDASGLLYLTVGVTREADGSLVLAGYPAFVGPPASGEAQPPSRVREVKNAALAAVVQRALRNYLAASGEELAADLTSTARVSLPGLALALTSVQQLGWSPDGSSVLAVVQAQDARGVSYTLDYELDVAAVDGRWEISAIQTNPDA